MLVRVCLLAAYLVFTSFALAQEKPKPDAPPQDAKQTWQDAVDELATAQQAFEDAEVALKVVDKKDKKLAAEPKKNCPLQRKT